MYNLASLDPSEISRFIEDDISQMFAQLRDEAPLHLCQESAFGAYWSLTRYCWHESMALGTPASAYYQLHAPVPCPALGGAVQGSWCKKPDTVRP